MVVGCGVCGCVLGGGEERGVVKRNGVIRIKSMLCGMLMCGM